MVIFGQVSQLKMTVKILFFSLFMFGAYQLLQVGEGGCGAVKELRQQPALLIATVADSCACKEINKNKKGIS